MANNIVNVSECNIITPSGYMERFYLPFKDRAMLASRIENVISSGGADCFRYKDVKGIVRIIPKKLLAKSDITFSTSHNKTFL